MSTASLSLRRRRRLVTAVYFILSGLITATWASRIPHVQAIIGLGNAAWGTVLFAVPLGLVTGLAIASWLTARFGIHATMIGSCLLSALLLATLGITANRWVLTALLFLTGFSRTILNIAMNAHSIETQRHYQQPIIVSFHGMWSLACLLAAAIGTGMLWLGIPPREHFIIMAVLCLIAVAVFSRDPDPAPPPAAASRPFFIMPDRYLLLIGLMTFCGMICENTMFDWSVNYFEHTVGAAKGAVTAGYTSFIIFMTAGRFIGDRLVRAAGALRLLVIHGLLIAGGFMVAVMFPTAFVAAAGFALVGLGASVVVPVMYALAARSERMPPSYALSSITLIGYAGFIIAPLLVGGLSDSIGMRGAFMVVGLMGLGLSGLALLLRLPQKDRETGGS